MTTKTQKLKTLYRSHIPVELIQQIARIRGTNYRELME